MAMKSREEVDALAEHIREEVRRHGDRLPTPTAPAETPPAERPMPEVPVVPASNGSPSATDALLAETGRLIAQAQSKTQVHGSVPKPLRPFWRNQGGYNSAVLRTVETLRDTNQQLAAENARLREQAANQTEWMHRLAQGMEQLQARLTGLEQQNDHDQRWFKKLQNHAEDQAAEIEKLNQREGAQVRRVQSSLEQLTEQQKRMDRSLARLDDRQTTDASFLKHQFWLQQRRSEAPSAGQEGRQPSAEVLGQDHDGSASAEATGDLDALYVAFENVFRGSRQDIKQRLEFYLPHLREAHLDAPGKTVLDLGCGRGEWLELLGEQGFTATGVDLNACMIEECRARGLPAHLANALEHLSSLPAESVGAVSAFHLIEHLPSDQLLRFFRECRRVLQPGGLAIFETPNPYNLVVGAAQFYDDHTHQRPLPPNSTRFLVEQAGFARADILPLHPRDDADKVHGDGTNPELVERFNELFYGPQDYAILAAVTAGGPACTSPS